MPVYIFFFFFFYQVFGFVQRFARMLALRLAMQLIGYRNSLREDRHRSAMWGATCYKRNGIGIAGSTEHKDILPVCGLVRLQCCEERPRQGDTHDVSAPRDAANDAVASLCLFAGTDPGSKSSTLRGARPYSDRRILLERYFAARPGEAVV